MALDNMVEEDDAEMDINYNLSEEEIESEGEVRDVASSERVSRTARQRIEELREEKALRKVLADDFFMD